MTQSHTHDVKPPYFSMKKKYIYAHMSLIRRLKERFHLSILPLEGDTRIGHGQ